MRRAASHPPPFHKVFFTKYQSFAQLRISIWQFALSAFEFKHISDLAGFWRLLALTIRKHYFRCLRSPSKIFLSKSKFYLGQEWLSRPRFVGIQPYFV